MFLECVFNAIETVTDPMETCFQYNAKLLMILKTCVTCTVNMLFKPWKKRSYPILYAPDNQLVCY